jgi:hypothetical protein
VILISSFSAVVGATAHHDKSICIGHVGTSCSSN